MISCEGFARKDESLSIKINPTFYYQDTVKMKKVSTFVDEYLKIHNNLNIVVESDWIVPSERNNWPVPDIEIQGIEYSPRFKKEGFYKPSIIAIRDLNAEITMVKIAYMHGFENGDAILACIFDLYLVEIDSRFYIYPQTPFLTKMWNRKNIGNITFVYDKNHVFNDSLAKLSDHFNSTISKFFNMPTLKYEYFISENSYQLYQIKGFNFSELMNFTNQYAGSADIINYKLFSGNGCEYYPHEQVHLYASKYFGNTFHLYSEGLATYFGGSRGYSLEKHIQKLKKYLNKHKEINLNNLLDYEGAIDDTTNIEYTLGGLLCATLIKKIGKNRFIELVDKTSSNPNNFYILLCDALKIKKEELHQTLIKEIEKY
jgi:hypothetical protein